jgi:hypothetical protein
VVSHASVTAAVDRSPSTLSTAALTAPGMAAIWSPS